MTSVQQCRKCAVVVTKDAQPNTSGCPESSFHHWDKVGPVGNTDYQCRKCGTHVKVQGNPNAFGCPEASQHHWYKL